MRKSELYRGRKRLVKKKAKERYDGDGCGGLLLGQPPPLPQSPSQVRCQGVGFFVFACQPAICHSERSDVPLNQSRRSAVGCVYCTHLSVCVRNCVCAYTYMNICAWGCEAKERSAFFSTGGHTEHTLHLPHTRQRTVFWMGQVLSPQTLFKSHFPMVTIITRPLDSLSFGLA